LTVTKSSKAALLLAKTFFLNHNNHPKVTSSVTLKHHKARDLKGKNEQ